MSETTLATFTPAQRAFYDALLKVDRKYVEIMRKMVDAWKADPAADLQPEDFGVPNGTPAWEAILDAVEEFDEAVGITEGDLDKAIPIVQPVLDAILGGSR
jgi:hypothetical protein